MRLIRVAVLAFVAVLEGTAAFGQALPNLSLLRVTYNSRKATVKPAGELKAQIDEIDKQLTEASRLGRNGDVRRLIAKGLTLLAGRDWTDADEFQASLVVRAERVVVDSAAKYRVRLEQIFAPQVELTRPLTAVASIRPRLAPPAPGASPAGPVTAPPPTPLGTFEGVSRDLDESPYALALDLSGLADGAYTLSVEVRDQDRSLGTATLAIAVEKGLDARLRALDTAAAKAPAALQADLRFPGDYIRKINDGVIGFGTFNPIAEVAAAESLAAATAKSKKDPFAGRTGDFKRHYLLTDAQEIMPYRMYVPKAYDGTKAYPLVIALHGLGQTEDSFFEAYGKRLPVLAEEHGYIVAAPLGYRVDGYYGWTLPSPSGNQVTRRQTELSERDVMEVLRRVRDGYKIDPTRIYLMGHSMGGIGTWAIAAKYPDIWAAIAPFSGLASPATVAQMRQLPEYVVHGDADPTVNVSGSRNMVAEMQKLGVEVKYVEVPGGDHSGVVAPNLPGMFEFFDAHRKVVSSSQD